MGATARDCAPWTGAAARSGAAAARYAEPRTVDSGPSPVGASRGERCWRRAALQVSIGSWWGQTPSAVANPDAAAVYAARS